MLVIMSLSLATVVMGTTGLNLVSPVFAGGDHHDHGGKKECKKYHNNNCNDTEKNQKLSTKTECETKTQSKITAIRMITRMSWYAVLMQQIQRFITNQF